MSEPTIDLSRCVPCEVCDKTCPKDLFRVTDGKPHLVEGAEAKCNHCMHCVAFCPRGAIRFKEFPGDTPIAFKPTPETADKVFSLLQSRRSMRHYRREALPKEVLEKLLHTVNYAPTGANRRELRWIVTETLDATNHVRELLIHWWDTVGRQDPTLSTPKKMASMFERLARGKDSITGQAPHMAFCVTKVGMNPNWESLDAGIALTYFNVAAEAMNIGCMLSGNSVAPSVDPALRAYLGIKEDEKLLCAIGFGRVIFHTKRIPVLPACNVTYIK